ncbi:hypothetical protein VTK56DRAFT_7986 [Thermocarpiscus australiensis]
MLSACTKGQYCSGCATVSYFDLLTMSNFVTRTLTVLGSAAKREVELTMLGRFRAQREIRSDFKSDGSRKRACEEKDGVGNGL